LLPIAILAVGAVATAIMVKSRKPVATRSPSEFAPFVRTVEAMPQTRKLSVTTHGTVTPRTETAIVAEVAGRVVDTAPAFASGGFFEKGEVLLTIDPVDYELAVVTARGEVARMRVRLETEEAQARVAREEWEALGRGEGTPLATRELQVKEAKAALAAAEASLRKAQRDLERTRVTAPFDCRLRKKQSDLGQYVAPGTPVALIYAIDYVEIRLPIPDAELAYLDISADFAGSSDGPGVTLSAHFAGERRTWRGRIVRVEGEIDPVSRMIHVVAQVDDPYRRTAENDTPLYIGMFVEATIEGQTIENAIVVPRSALRGDGVVLVVGDDAIMRFRSVEVKRTDGDVAIISSGLTRGERVCVSTLEAVTDGMKVRTEETVRDAGEETASGKKENGS
jgi:RND family efflux transporter MFP subunit